MKPLRILFVLDNGMTQTSAWVRALQYREPLAARADVSAAFVSHRPATLARLQTWLARRSAPAFLRGLVGRLSQFFSRRRETRIARMAGDFDVVYVLLVPSLRLYEKLAAVRDRGQGPRIFMDVIDALWLPPRRGVWRDLPRMLALADGVICENRFVADYVRRFQPKVAIVPDSPQVEAFDRLRPQIRRSPEKITLGWIGAPGSSSALFAIFEPLEKLFAKYSGLPLHLRIVGADPERIPRFENVSWSLLPRYDQSRMVEEALAMDIGLFPLFDTGESLMRGTLKAMVYMSGEAVAVCRNLGENADLIQDGVNGMLADSPEDWFEKLETLILDPALRRRLAARGLETIREKFTRERCLEKLLAAFRETASGSA